MNYDQNLEAARLQIESDMVRRTGTGMSLPPQGDRLDNVTDMIVLLVDRYRKTTKYLIGAIILLVIGTIGLGVILGTMLETQSKLEKVLVEQENLINQSKATKQAVTEAKQEISKTQQEVSETREAVEKAAEPPPSASAKPKRK